MTIYRVADLFCGAGGFSTGAQSAIRAAGADLELVAVNHWPTAIATHSRNHPHARHTIADVYAADPYDLVPEGQPNLLLDSPECVHYSRARGGKPFHNQGRMNPWVIHTGSPNWVCIPSSSKMCPSSPLGAADQARTPRPGTGPASTAKPGSLPCKRGAARRNGAS